MLKFDKDGHIDFGEECEMCGHREFYHQEIYPNKWCDGIGTIGCDCKGFVHPMDM